MSPPRRVKRALISAPLLLLSALFMGAAQGEPPAVRIDRVVVVVGDSVLTDSRLKLLAAMAERDSSVVPTLADAPTDPQHAGIEVAILRRIAGDLPVYQPSASDVRARTSRFRESWTSPREFHRFLRTHGLDEVRLAEELKQRMVVERVVRRNLPRNLDEPEPDYRIRYAIWIGDHRATTPIRMIPEQGL
jgi:hypothetical protein